MIPRSNIAGSEFIEAEIRFEKFFGHASRLKPCRWPADAGKQLDREAQRSDVYRRAAHGERIEGGDMPLTLEAQQAIDFAYDEARELNVDYVGTEHLLLGVARSRDACWKNAG